MSISETFPPVQQMPWPEAVRRISERAHAALPDALHGRAEMATALVLNGKVWFEDDGHTAYVLSSNDTTWYPVNGACTCEDFARTQHGLCKHRMAVRIYARAGQLLREGLATESTTAEAVAQCPACQATVYTPHTCPHADAPEHPRIPPQYIQTVHGKPFVLYAGLLAMAHANGLVKLEASFVSVTSELALATATATFADGRIFTEAADASPTNVNKGVAAHFARCAITRAKARALRDALNIDCCAVEELEN